MCQRSLCLCMFYVLCIFLTISVYVLSVYIYITSYLHDTLYVWILATAFITYFLVVQTRIFVFYFLYYIFLFSVCIVCMSVAFVLLVYIYLYTTLCYSFYHCIFPLILPISIIIIVINIRSLYSHTILSPSIDQSSTIIIYNNILWNTLWCCILY